MQYVVKFEVVVEAENEDNAVKAAKIAGINHLGPVEVIKMDEDTDLDYYDDDWLDDEDDFDDWDEDEEDSYLEL